MGASLLRLLLSAIMSPTYNSAQMFIRHKLISEGELRTWVVGTSQ